MAWRNGSYAVQIALTGGDRPELGSSCGYHGFFNDKGSPITDMKGIAGLIQNNDWRAVTVELDDSSLCVRCAAIAKREGT